MKNVMAVLLTLACAALLCGWAAARDAERPIDPAAFGGPDRHPGHETLWSQGPAGGIYAVASQLAPDYPFYAETANDFYALRNAEVNHIHWWGLWYPPPRDGRPALSVEPVEWGGQGTRALTCNDALYAACNVVITGDNTGGPNHADYYNCSGWLEDGPEVVYLITIPRTPTVLALSLSDVTADLDVFLLSACSENACITYGDWGFTVELPAGEYYLVVDGYHGATSAYTLTFECGGVPPLYFAARFYDNAAEEPGNLLYEHYFSDYSETWNEGLGQFEYWADIPPFPIVQGQFYWMSIQAVLAFNAHGQWYWHIADNELLEWPVMYFDALGIPRWTPIPDAVGQASDVAFELAEIGTPVEARSWGVIKSLYR